MSHHGNYILLEFNLRPTFIYFRIPQYNICYLKNHFKNTFLFRDVMKLAQK